MIAKVLTLGGLALLMAGTTAVAHHSHNAYDSDNEVALRGVVKDFEWTNPHVWIHVVVTDDSGSEVEWALEGSAPSSLARRGWTPKSLTPGEEITVSVYPLKNGDPGGNWHGEVTLGDGSTVH